MDKKPIIKHIAQNDPALKFWAEKLDLSPAKECYAVISQVDGFPAAEAHDDWFARLEDADEIALQLARDAQVPDAAVLALRAEKL